jgi:hypothetical protein
MKDYETRMQDKEDLFVNLVEFVEKSYKAYFDISVIERMTVNE